MQSDLTHSTSAKNPISCITVLDIKLHKGHNLNKTFWQKGRYYNDCLFCKNLTLGLLLVKSLGFDNTIDPYISFEVTEPLSTANNAIQKSSIKENNENPIWEEEITIPVDISKPGRLQMTLWDSNLLSDSQISYPVFVDLNGLAVGAKYQRQTVKIHVRLTFSNAASNEELIMIVVRKLVPLKSLYVCEGTVYTYSQLSFMYT